MMPAPTERQVEVLRSVLETASVKTAAHDLGISTSTVRGHIERARGRTCSESRDQLIAWLDDYLAGWRGRRPAA